jgi:quercetin dioxygenase-like cupin family protein
MDPYALKAGEGPTYQYGVPFTVKAGELKTTNGAAVTEYTTCKGEEPNDHTHPTEDEMFYVLDGSLTFRCGDRTFDLEAGGFVFLPRGIKHGYTIHGDDPARLLVVTAPPREPSPSWQGFVADFEASGDTVDHSPAE